VTPRRARVLGIGIAALVFIVDQLLKWWVVGPLDLMRVGQIYVMPVFNLTFTQNYGVSLGLFEARSATGQWILVGVTAGIALFVAIWLLREKLMGDIAGLALVLGGALGNIVDRATVGYVIDYADLHFGEWRPFLIFNLADAAITIGVLFILARSFLSREKRPDDEPEQAPGESTSAASES
jgi:signal peptidase II